MKALGTHSKSARCRPCPRCWADTEEDDTSHIVGLAVGKVRIILETKGRDQQRGIWWGVWGKPVQLWQLGELPTADGWAESQG